MKQNPLRKSGIALLTLVVMGAVVLSQRHAALGAQLTNARDYLNRQQASVTTGIQHEVFLKPTTAVSGGAGNNKVILVFPDGDDGLWCRTAGSLTVTAITNPTGATETSGNNLPGTLTGACTQGAGASSFDTFTVSGVNDLSAGTNYGVRFVGNTAVLGTAAAANDIKVTVKTNNGSSDIDTHIIAISLVASDQINVTATIDQTLSVALSSTSVALGTLSATQVNQGGITSTVSTSAANGYISEIAYDHTLQVGALTIGDTAGGTIVAGQAEYGVSSSQSGNTIGVWSPTSCANTGSTSNATALSTTFQTFAASASAATNDITTICFLASISGTTAPGSYTSTATLVTTARF
jgi:hypothetical protein